MEKVVAGLTVCRVSAAASTGAAATSDVIDRNIAVPMSAPAATFKYCNMMQTLALDSLSVTAPSGPKTIDKIEAGRLFHPIPTSANLIDLLCPQASPHAGW